MPETLKPGDLLRQPLESSGDGDKPEPDDKILPGIWKQAIQDARKWPFVDPDVMHEEEVDSYADFPADIEGVEEADSLLKEVPDYSEFEPWGKMDGETDRDYELFAHYLARGLSRTYADTARHHGISQPYVSRVANKNDWPDRVRAWDDYREKIYTSTVIQRTKKMAEDHAGIAAKGIAALSLVFEEILTRAEEDPEGHKAELRELNFRGLFTMAEKAARALPNLMGAERLSRGLPTELTADIQVKENRVVVQTTEDLAEVVAGLFEVMDTGADADEGEGEGEIVDAEVIEDDPGEEE